MGTTGVECSDSLDDFIYLDEFGLNLQFLRKFGHAPRGVRPVKRVEAQGFHAFEINLKVYKGILFAHFFQNKLFPKRDCHRVIVMDNCRIHKEKTVFNVFQLAHHTPLFLSAYPPHLNVAEWVFSCVKGQVKKSKIKKHTLAGVIRRSLKRSVTAVNVGEWMKEVKRNFLLVLEGYPPVAL